MSESKFLSKEWFDFINWCLENDKAKYYRMTALYAVDVNSMPQSAKDDLLAARIEYDAYLKEASKTRKLHESNTSWKLY